eukprot:3306729-Pyramimonas_sp.AAC.1
MASRADLDALHESVAGALRSRNHAARIEDYAADLLGERRQSKFAIALIELAAWGVLSSTLCQFLAEAVVEDARPHEPHPEVLKISEIGFGGTYPGNCRRDLFNQYAKNIDLPKPTQVRIPYVETHLGNE